MIRSGKLSKRSIQLTLGILLGIFLLSQLKSPLSAMQVGGPCEGCEAVLEYGSRTLSTTDTLPEFKTHNNQMIIQGTVYQPDGKTPAANVIVYAYHTNEKGVYPKKGDEKGYARRHGYLQGWVKTDKAGKYTFYTFKPASYPSRTEPAHVHLTIKESDKNPYYIDSIEFDDDALLTQKHRSKRKNRGSSGIVRLTKNAQGLLLCQRDIYLGKNIPQYPR